MSYSKRVDPEYAKKQGWSSDDNEDDDASRTIIKQYIASPYDFSYLDDIKISLRKRLVWKLERLLIWWKRDVLLPVITHIRWHNVLKELRPWVGYSGMIKLMQFMLRHYASYEEQYSCSAKEYKDSAVNSARETADLLERLKEPTEYSSRRRDEVKERYPEYLELRTDYADGSSMKSGYFIPQGKGFVGPASEQFESNYFEIVNDRIISLDSPDKLETERLVNEIIKYDKEIDEAYELAQKDLENDFDKLNQLLRENMYYWWT